MSELVKINLIRKLEEIGIFNHGIDKITRENNEWCVYDCDGVFMFLILEEAYKELDKF